jgi:hypothetical protein
MNRTAAQHPTLHLVAALVASMLPSSAHAASWVFVGNCGEGHEIRAYSYDAASIRKDDGNVLVWVKGDYSRTIGSQAREAKMLWSFDCPGKALIELSRAEYAADGKLVSSYEQRTPSMGLPRGSMAAKVYSAVCA